MSFLLLLQELVTALMLDHVEGRSGYDANADYNRLFLQSGTPATATATAATAAPAEVRLAVHSLLAHAPCYRLVALIPLTLFHSVLLLAQRSGAKRTATDTDDAPGSKRQKVAGGPIEPNEDGSFSVRVAAAVSWAAVSRAAVSRARHRPCL